MPLQLAFEELYFFAYQFCGNSGLSIIALSLIVNLLVLPLYDRADAMQIAQRDIEAKLRKGVEHIKKTFKGDEQLMMLQTYYRQNNYSPTDIIKGSISLFLEIPFFVAAYQFLSHLEILKGVGLGPIKDLGAPDALLTVAGITINAMPIIMTLLNVVSAYIFTRDFPLKTKIQLQGMALFFLIFLYSSPSGLVFYWTLNNLFNLIKTVIYKLDNPEKGAQVVLAVCSLVIIVYAFFFLPHPTKTKKAFGVLCALALNMPFIIQMVKKHFNIFDNGREIKNNRKLFLAGGLFLSLLLGAMIPSAVIEASPQEFVILNYFTQPLWYIVSAFSIAFGSFVVWFGVFYWLAPRNYKAKFDYAIWLMCGIAITNYMFFGKKLGILSNTLQYEEGLKFASSEIILNLFAIILIIGLSTIIWKKSQKLISDILVLSSVALMCMIFINIITIQKQTNGISLFSSSKITDKLFNLSKSGKNVVVIMLDRSVGEYIPYLFNEKPILKKQFDGFTLYPNTISYGGITNIGAAGLFGGYEYIPEEMNKRNTFLLKDKHNEALKLMPVVLYNNKFDVTVCDLPYANYKYIPDFSIFNDYPGIKSHITIGNYGKSIDKSILDEKEETVVNNNRNFYCYSIVKCIPVVLQRYFYNDGKYNALNKEIENQEITSLYKAKGINKRFLNNYNVLKNLPGITGITEGGNNALFLANDITHAPCLLQESEYIPKYEVNNTKYKNGEKKNILKNKNQITHYHVNMAAMLQLGKWFDYLRDKGVYDNTRIILVSDHGWKISNKKDLLFKTKLDIQLFRPLLMMKDFNCQSFKIDDQFMINADVPNMVFNSIVNDPVNPFTGKHLNLLNKKDNRVFVFGSYIWNVNKNNGKTFKPGPWYSVEKDVRDKKNWKLVKENAVLPY